jgi:hypothetical protein
LSRHREYHSIALSLRSWPQFVPFGEREMEKQRIAQTLKSHGIVAYQGLFILLSGGTWTDAIWSFVPGWRNLLHLLAIFAVGPWFDGSLGTSLSSGQF